MLNNKWFMAVKLGHKCVIGDHSIVLLKRSEFLYKALTDLDCYGLRKDKSHQILDKYKEFGGKIKTKIVTKYQNLIRKPVLKHKENTINKLKGSNKFELQNRGSDIWPDENTAEEELKDLKKKIERRGGDTKGAMRRIKKLEDKVEKLGNTVYQLFSRYDDTLRDIAEF